ncbi:MAG: site-2 protease family protein [Erysipelotrichaceae bacterium]|nr:site-2 protease family protein [Erysipelotrichaceae bacterium]
MTTLRDLFLFIFMLLVIVSLHELGHLLAAKFFGVYCKEFSFGMGPKLWSYQGKETEYSIRAFPIGGFVAMAGDNDNSLETEVDDSDIPYERTLKGIARWKRVIIMLAGIFVNILLGYIIFSLVILHNGVYVKSTKPVISGVVSGSPAETVGIKKGDIVTEIGFNDINIVPEDYYEIVSFTGAYQGEGPWTLVVNRDGEKIRFEVTPEYSDGRYYIGISFANAASELVEVNIFNCWYYGFKYSFFMVKLIWGALLSLFRGKNLDTVSGPVGIYSTVSQTADMGFGVYIQLVAMISLNAGIANALPLPIFDGGRVFLLLIEMIRGKELSKKAENIIMTASVALLMMLLLFTTYNDISKIIGG